MSYWGLRMLYQVLGIVVFQLTRTIVIEHIEFVTREAKTSGTEQKKLESCDHFSTKKKNTKEAKHKLNVSYFDHLIAISISKSNN